MTPEIKEDYEKLFDNDKELRYGAFVRLLEATEQPVNWAYEIWPTLVELTAAKDNHLRTMAVQLLSNLAKSDPEHRIKSDYPTVYHVTFDDKFVTARHSLQCLWKIAIVNEENLRLVIDSLTTRFREAVKEKNGTLVRYDILEVFKHIHKHNNNQSIRQLALELIVTEADAKYKKKYTALWKTA